MDPYQAITAYYDLEHDAYQDDVDFYLNLLQRGPILEVGAGTGRVMLPLARSGLEVWGVDPSEAMLQRARNRLAGQQRAHLVCRSARDLRLDVRFAAVLLSLNALWHLPDIDAQVDTLNSLRAHLLQDGMLIVDVSNPYTMLDRGARGETRRRFAAAAEGKHVEGFSAAWDDPGRQRLLLSLMYDETAADGVLRRTRTQLDLRYVYRYELELLLRLTRFRIHSLYGSYDLEEYGETSPNIIVVASPG